MGNRILLSVVTFTGIVACAYLVSEADCNCSTCCTTDYCECICANAFKRCVSYSEPQALNNILNFTGGNCGGSFHVDGQNQILTWSNQVQQCYCYDFYGQDCAGTQEGVCGAVIRLDGIAGQHFCVWGG